MHVINAQMDAPNVSMIAAECVGALVIAAANAVATHAISVAGAVQKDAMG